MTPPCVKPFFTHTNPPEHGDPSLLGGHTVTAATFVGDEKFVDSSQLDGAEDKVELGREDQGKFFFLFRASACCPPL